MQEITTGNLTDILLHPGLSGFAQYKEAHLRQYEEVDFSAYYNAPLKEKGVSRSEAIKNSGIEVHYAYQILSGQKNPGRDKTICLCIGAGFCLKETQRALSFSLLGRLYPKIERDAVIMLATIRAFQPRWRSMSFSQHIIWTCCPKEIMPAV